VKVETLVVATEYKNGKDLWDWLIWSKPFVEKVLGGMLKLTKGEREIVRQSLENLVRQRAGVRNAAILSNPVNIGFGIK